MDLQSQNPSYTLLRIKRKRTEEPLDALVVESRSRQKKSRAGIDVFKFAETVEHDAWEDNQLRQHLQSHVSKLAQDSNENAKAHSPPGQEAKLPPPLSRTDSGARRYAVQVTGSGEDAMSNRRLTNPPKVISAKDIPLDFKMYDAVLEVQDPTLPLTDPEVEKFLHMVQDYLTLDETRNTNSGATPRGDYVWDVFYRRAYSLSEWNSIAANVGTLTGLPPSVEDGELSGDSQSEEEDEADEDSNAEEYYKNDYPDEESSDDDYFDADSDDEDDFSDAADSDHQWR